MRTFDTRKVKAATSQYSDDITGFEPHSWLFNPNNVALINDKNDIALFEHQADLFNTVCGHYFFFSRGKDALKAAKEFLEEIFSEQYNVDTITGLTPIDHKGALWLNRQLGFRENGNVETEIGPCRFVMLTKNQWKEAGR